MAGNLSAIRSRIAAAARRSGRRPEDITLVGVSKTVAAGTVREAIDAGLGDLGENRVQEARDKAAALPKSVRWHLVGHLQGNKANLAARLFDVVHSIDSVDLLERLERALERENRRMLGLVQVDLAGETTKFGAPAGEIDAILRAAAGMKRVEVAGFMILPPHEEDAENSRRYFRRLAELLREKAALHPGLSLRHLSMGMTEDFEVAIEEGATMVRVGRALFGERRAA